MNGNHTFRDIKGEKYFKVEQSSLPLFLAIQFESYDKIVFFVNNNLEIIKLKDSLKSINNKIPIFEFPSFDCNFLSNMSPTIDNKTSRIKTLFNLIKDNKMILICSLESLVEKTLSFDKLIHKELVINKKQKYSYNEILEYLKTNNYEKVDFINNVGEFSTRGEVIDIYSPVEDLPVRIYFNFENIEKIKQFSLNNQETFITIEKYSLYPVSEINFTDENIKFFREQYRELGLEKDEYYESISQKIFIEGSEQFFPILERKFSSILEYLRGFKFFFQQNFENEFEHLYKKKIIEFSNYSKYFSSKSDFLLDPITLKKLLKKEDINDISSVITTSQKRYNFSDEININKNIKKLINLIDQKDSKIILCYNGKVNESKFKNLTSYLKKKIVEFENLFEQEILANKINLIKLNIEKSFKIYNKGEVIYFISDNDVFDKVKKKNTKKFLENTSFIKDFSQLKIGDLVVHIDHGIGVYNGLKTNNLAGFDQDFIEILYLDNDKLFIPIQNLELISKYGDSDTKISLDKLGLSSWQKRKALVKKKIKDIATDLVKIAATRQLMKAEVVESNSFEYEKFSSKFEFTETSDQIRAIEDVKLDLCSGKPMDRLICGDVGFGKTEIAMRASFICMSAGFQVVMICPKVLLVNQHYETFYRRFKDFGYKIAKISRLEKNNLKKEIKTGISKGDVNLLISTHAIFAKDVSFNNLGLIIIDEEQSFGVEQKEKLKKFKPNCHILTLTATPIPRTLQSSIFQIKDISLIQTPPVNRINIKTFLMIEDLNQIKKIIEYELERNGQIFYVTPRIKDIENIRKKVLSVIPNLNLACIHGKLNTNEIDNVYNDFYNKKIDVLLSTAMIESGLDLSNVNTIIIDKPNLFGLAQLYQLRGRVGRSSIQAYAYLIIDNLRNLNEDSLKKVKIISKIDKLGAGLSIASNDLSIRGGGNIIGAEQSGHIKEVGIELYYKMVQDTVNELQNLKPQNENWSPQINLGFSINIPSKYEKNSDQRLSIYRDLAQIRTTEELKNVEKTIEDKYGKLSTNFQNLFFLIEIKIIAKELFIKKIDDTSTGFVLEFMEESKLNISKLLNYAKFNPKIVRLMPKSKILYYTIAKKIKKINDLKNFLFFIKTNLIT